MNYTILKQWKTLDGKYHSATVDKPDFDLAIGEFHSMFKPMQNDLNVVFFSLRMIDENGVFTGEKCSWTRTIPEPEPEIVEEVSEEVVEGGE